ncbi:transposase, partial [Escherichia coli]
GTADRNRSHWSTSKTPSYTKSVSWQHHRNFKTAQNTQIRTRK